MPSPRESLSEICRVAGHEYLLNHWERLTPGEREELEKQIRTLDFELLRRLSPNAQAEFGQGDCSEGNSDDWIALSARAEPPDAVRLGELYRGISTRDAYDEGARALSDGKVAMILVAGGQGTRLGFDLPKGMYPIGPVSGRTLFEMHVDSLKGAMRRFGVSIPLWIMTGPSTHAPTEAYFAEHENLGLRPDELFLFQQGTMPAIDATHGRILMESPSQLALSPDGHGGIVAALARCGALAMAKQRGVEQFFYAQVDNPMVTACDPIMVGYHRLARSQMTTQVVPKRFAKERVGNVVSIDGKTQIIEYSDLPDVAAEKTNPDGSLKLWAGNIAVHVFDLEFLEATAASERGLPFHRAHKAVPFVDESGELQKPSKPNAIKFERFVFDLLPMAERTLVIEGDASQVFAPVKNADGAPTDTPSATKQAISNLHARWLADAGVIVKPGVQVEINPMWALDPEEVLQKIKAPANVVADTYFA